jgi:hypothetical protein
MQGVKKQQMQAYDSVVMLGICACLPLFQDPGLRQSLVSLSARNLLPAAFRLAYMPQHSVKNPIVVICGT